MFRYLKRWRFHIFLGLLVVLGCFMRFHNIEKKSLWADELFTLSMAQYHPLVPEAGQPWYRSTSVMDIRDGDTFLSAKAGEQSPPLQDLLEKASVRVLGSTDFAARFPGALAACVLLVWFAWFAARATDPWERSVLTWSLLLLTLSPALVIYAIDARAYSLGVSLLGMGGLLWLRRWRGGWRQVTPPGWGEIALFTLAAYTHYNAAALVAILLSFDALVAVKKRSGTTWVRLLTLGGIFSLWLIANAHTILFTKNGGVAWGAFTTQQAIFASFVGAFNAMHLPWVLLMLALAWLVAARQFFYRPEVAFPYWSRALFYLMGLVILHEALVGVIVAKAGMAHPRYYIFTLPLFVVAFSILLAEFRGWVPIVLAGTVVSLLAVPGMRSRELGNFEDWREMSRAAASGTDADTLFVYPWGPNRDLYRVYLERFTGRDVRPQLVGISSPGEIPAVCARLAQSKHVVAVAHQSGRAIIDDIYAACGATWPKRELSQFQGAFSEHWRAGN